MKIQCDKNRETPELPRRAGRSGNIAYRRCHSEITILIVLNF